ncbi:unnamed protein product [Phytophthora lilii]|uniref:RxLR effector protein n=1 Tax=Phytophthora lilii TaxID=2077276 RepID=A0A9W6WTR5_9STRA|nr:unnamed protein product [Phytophthora lilii]
MRFYHLVLLVTAILLATGGSTAEPKGLKLTLTDNTSHQVNTVTPTKRFLRAYSPDKEDEDTEERGISVKLPGLEKISNVFKSSKTKQLEGLIKADDSIGNAFKALQLSKMPIDKNGFIETEMVNKFFSSTNFKVWSKHVARLNKKNPEAAMLQHLTNVFGEKEAAIMIMLSQLRRNTRGIGKKLEAAQFNKWFTKRKFPPQIVEDVFKVKFNDIHKEPRVKAVFIDYSKYFTNRVETY